MFWSTYHFVELKYYCYLIQYLLYLYTNHVYQNAHPWMDITNLKTPPGILPTYLPAVRVMMGGGWVSPIE